MPAGMRWPEAHQWAPVCKSSTEAKVRRRPQEPSFIFPPGGLQRWASLNSPPRAFRTEVFINHFFPWHARHGHSWPRCECPPPRQSPPGTGEGHQRWAGGVGGPGMQGVWLQMSAGLFRSSQEGCEPWRAWAMGILTLVIPEGPRRSAGGTGAFDRLVPTASIPSPSGPLLPAPQG